jgi:hypothetical protein
MLLQVKATGNQGKNEALAWIKGVGKDKHLTSCAGSQSWMCVYSQSVRGFFFTFFLSRCINKGKIEAQPQMCLKHFINGVLQPFSSQFAMLPPPPPYTSILSASDSVTPAISAAIGEAPVPASSQALPAQSSEVRGVSCATCCQSSHAFVSYAWRLA